MPQGRVHTYLECASSLDDNSLVVRETPQVILVVEDDGAVRAPLVKFLQMRQYVVVAVETADEGVAAIASHKPSAALVDLNLRTGSGRDVLAAMPAETPVIIFSGLRVEVTEFESRPRTIIVPKPYSLITLMDTLQDMLESGAGGRFGRAAS